ncbi:MAG TPA: ECF transporter S component [Clostridiaceae bacterium]|nr:ECF transporter S component [Clostridiaceae bacterium]
MKKVFKNPRNLAFLGLMLGITIILDMTPLGMIPLGAISATIIHIPTIITGIVLGPAAGLIMGTALGFVGWIHALTRPATILDPFFMNPLISVLPRIFIGVIAYFVYLGVTKLIEKKSVKSAVSTFIGGMAGSITNTILVFLMLYLIYAKELVEKAGMSFGVILVSVITTNAIAEAIISGLITMTVASAYFRYAKTQKT